MKLKSILASLLLAFTMSMFSGNADAQKRKSSKSKTVHVKSYTKKNGTHVRAHTRSRRS